MPGLQERIATDSAYVVSLRHDLHEHPELGYQEQRTSSVVAEELAKIGVEHFRGLAGGTGVLAYLPATTKDPAKAQTIALRADMDALPISENTGKSYASKNPGVMHACGHDGHTSILIGAARILNDSERPNNVLLLFQPAEEGGGGGKRMCDDGALTGKVLGNPADMIYGLHGNPYFHVGQIATRTGALLASADGFELKIIGKGGHAAMPHMGIDPVVVASTIITSLQTICSRNVSPLDPIVVTIGKIEAGTASNIIPDKAFMSGTLRALHEETRELGIRRISEMCASVAEGFGAKAEIEWTYGYPVTYNEARATSRFRSIIGSTIGDGLVPDDVLPVMGAEDFSFYGRVVPASFFWLGLKNAGQDFYPNLHAPEFDFNDKSLAVGVRAMCELALSEQPLEGASDPASKLVMA
jgi:amidohydrolase